VIPREPTTGDLRPWARRAFEDAYRRRPREQASREDVAYGFLHALVWARVASAFHDAGPDTWPAEAASPADESRSQGTSQAGMGGVGGPYRPGVLPGKRRVRYDGR